MDHLNDTRSWQQGAFIPFPKYQDMPSEWKNARRQEEEHLVRPDPTSNAICRTPEPAHAKWIAERLNLTAKVQRLVQTELDDADLGLKVRELFATR